MLGKEKCKLLKQLRKEIADANGIEYVVEECKFKGNCKGTCPKCDAELLELTKKVEAKKKAGLVGLGVGIVSLGLVGCTDVKPAETLSGDVEVLPTDKEIEVESSMQEELQGPVSGIIGVDETEDIRLSGDVVYNDTEDELIEELDGDVEYIDEFEGIDEVNANCTVGEDSLQQEDESEEDEQLKPLAGSVEYKKDSFWDILK